jgi:hypothetical protein
MKTRHTFPRFQDKDGIAFSRRKGKNRPPMIPQEPTEKVPNQNI